MKTDWQPIETAPKDGTVIQLFDPDHFKESSGQFMGNYDEGWYSEHYDWILNPTHWMPLPEPPA